MRTTEKWREEIEKGVMPASVLKTYVPERVEASTEGDIRKAAFVVSTGSEDRDGDTVNPAGWVLDNYRKNPIVLWAHSIKDLPIARAESIGVEGGKLKSVTVFPKPGVYPFADQVYGLVRDGFLKGTSVGFHPLEAAPRKGKSKGIDFARQELYEFSLLPIPSNREALVEAKAAGHDVAMVVKWASDFLDYAEAEGIWVPKYQIEKALKLVLPLQVSVPAMPPSQAGAGSEGHAIAGADLSDAEVKGLLDIIEKGDATGHPFRGNQYGGGKTGDAEAQRAEDRGGKSGWLNAEIARHNAEVRATQPKDDMAKWTEDNRKLKFEAMDAAMKTPPTRADSTKPAKDETVPPANVGTTREQAALNGPVGGDPINERRFMDHAGEMWSRGTHPTLGTELVHEATGAHHYPDHKGKPAPPKRKKKGIEEEIMVDEVQALADALFGEGVTKGAPPWAKEAPAAAGPPPGTKPDAKGKVNPDEAAKAARQAAQDHNDSQKDAEPDPNDPNESAEQAAGEPDEQNGAGGPDQLEAGLLTEIAGLKQGGDPVQIATALKAALEKFAAAFMQTYAQNPATASPATPAGPGAPGAQPNTPAPGGQPSAQPATPGSAAVTPAAAGAAAPQAVPQPKKPVPPQFKKGIDIPELGISLDENELRDTISKAVTRQMAEARMHLTGKLPG
jgi:HK97 family phage prohead protease